MSAFEVGELLKNRGQYGTEILRSNDGIIKGATIMYSKVEELQKAEENVDSFITNESHNLDNFRIFKSILREKIITGKEAVHDYDYSEISDYLPWVFSPKYLFEPFRSILYCTINEIDLSLAWEVLSTVENEAINEGAMRAIYESIKYQQPYVELAMNAFNTQYQGLLGKMYLLSENFIIKNYVYFDSLFDKAVGKLGKNIVAKMGKAAVKGIKLGAEWAKEKGQALVNLFRIDRRYENDAFKPSADGAEEILQIKGSISKILKLMMKDLKVYGEVVINMGYMNHVGKTKIVNDKMYYYSPDHPEIFLTMQNAQVKVYLLKNNELKLIPDGSFNKELLRGIVMNDVIYLGGRLFKRLKEEYSETPEQKEARTNFATNYLNFGNGENLRQKLEINRNLKFSDYIKEFKEKVAEEKNKENLG